MSESKSISLSGSDNLFWEDVETYSRKQGFVTTSSFIQYLLEKEIFGIRKKLQDTITYVMLLIIIVMILMLLLIR